MILRELKIRGLVRRILVVAPAGLVLQWQSEMKSLFNEDFRLILPSSLSALRQAGAIDENENLWRMHQQVICPLDSVKRSTPEGWILLPTAYDDGGLSGGSMERPSLRRLLDDVRNGLVDIVVVYKVDRLTRSLADFCEADGVVRRARHIDAGQTERLLRAAAMPSLTLSDSSTETSSNDPVQGLITRVVIGPGRLAITLDRPSLARRLGELTFNIQRHLICRRTLRNARAGAMEQWRPRRCRMIRIRRRSRLGDPAAVAVTGPGAQQ